MRLYNAVKRVLDDIDRPFDADPDLHCIDELRTAKKAYEVVTDRVFWEDVLNDFPRSGGIEEQIDFMIERVKGRG